MNVAHVSVDLIRSLTSNGGGSDDGKLTDCFAILHLDTSRTKKINICTLLRLKSSFGDHDRLRNKLHAQDVQSITINQTLFEVLLHSHSIMVTEEHSNCDALETNPDKSWHKVQVLGCKETGSDDLHIADGWLERISIEHISSTDLDSSSNSTANEITINLRYMCSNSEKCRKHFKDAKNYGPAIQVLRDAVIAEGTILGIDHRWKKDTGAAQDVSFFMVEQINNFTQSSLQYVHLSNEIFNIKLIPPETNNGANPQNIDAAFTHHCPGYGSTLNELCNLASFGNLDGRPSAVILSGCAGVGKTRMAALLEDELSMTKQLASVKISSKDVLLEEASSTFETSRIVDQLGQPGGKSMLLVIDDLDDIIGDSDSADSKHESEQMRAMNAIAKLIDDTTAKFSSSCFILGLCRASWAELPVQLARVGRFEKMITMPSPTQIQRKEIFKFWLSTIPFSSDANFSADDQLIIEEWAELLTPRTAGCVASDIQRICADALTSATARAESKNGNNRPKVKWEDIKEAARLCIPSQLSSLDVIPSNLRDYDGKEKSILQPREEFKLAWRNFGGYHLEKKRLYTAIVKPWSYHINHKDSSSPSSIGITKPSGVLFHGPSGNGKSRAAICLASSIGLHCVKVKASEVFNQWLGGSEANLRSIFSRARAASPCILFFDELDALAMNRESQNSDAMSGVQSRILTTLLNEMDGISNVGGQQDILVVAATNRLDSIDAALLRPGRLEEHVLLSYPSSESICEILQLQTSKMPLDKSVDLGKLSHTLSAARCSCAEVEGICRDACLIAIRRSSSEDSTSDELYVTRSDFTEAFQRIKRG